MLLSFKAELVLKLDSAVAREEQVKTYVPGATYRVVHGILMKMESEP